MVDEIREYKVKPCLAGNEVLVVWHEEGEEVRFHRYVEFRSGKDEEAEPTQENEPGVQRVYRGVNEKAIIDIIANAGEVFRGSAGFWFDLEHLTNEALDELILEQVDEQNKNNSYTPSRQYL